MDYHECRGLVLLRKYVDIIVMYQYFPLCLYGCVRAFSTIRWDQHSHHNVCLIASIYYRVQSCLTSSPISEKGPWGFFLLPYTIFILYQIPLPVYHVPFFVPPITSPY